MFSGTKGNTIRDAADASELAPILGEPRKARLLYSLGAAHARRESCFVKLSRHV